MRNSDLYIQNNLIEDVLTSSDEQMDSRNFSSSHKPLISVIVPVFREEKILAGTLSVYTKELKNKYDFELIVSDGGSKDKTIEIAQKFADKIFVHSEERKQTISEGRNKGAELAEGKILVFINGDTIPANPDSFFSFVRDWANLQIFPESKAIACKVTVSDDEKKLRDIIFYSLHNQYIRLLNKVGMGMGRGECQIVRRDVFIEVGGYNSSIAAGEDFDLYQRISRRGKIVFTRKISVLESPRRFRKYGYIRIIYSWIVNSLSVMISGKSVSKEWEAVR